MQSGFEQKGFSIILKSIFCITQIIKITLITVKKRGGLLFLLDFDPGLCFINEKIKHEPNRV
jgi:hypothetical protein